jgi:hypothetical protein
MDMDYDVVITTVKDNNKYMRHYQAGERFIYIRQLDSEYRLSPYHEWECQHIHTHRESIAVDYMTFEGPKQYEEKATVCNECDETIENMEWDHE